MKKLPLRFPIAVLMIVISPVALGEEAAPDPTAIVVEVQDERMADVEAVQAALKQADGPAKGAIEAAFLERERARDEESGAASLQAELARQAEMARQRAAETSQP